MTFKELRNFIVCSESKTLSLAAERLGMAQPSLSLSLKKLETELGYSLFIRGREGLRITPQGKNLLPDAKVVLDSLARMGGRKTVQKFKIGCHPSVGMFVLGKFLKLMYHEQPTLEFEIINAASAVVNKMVAAGDVDFGVVMNPITFQGLVIKSIGEDYVHVWESSHRYNDKLIFNPQSLQSLSVVSRWKSAPAQTINVQNPELIANLTFSGAGFGILPSQVVKAQGFNLKKVINTPSAKDHLALVCYPETLRSIEGRAVFDALKRSYN